MVYMKFKAGGPEATTKKEEDTYLTSRPVL